MKNLRTGRLKNRYLPNLFQQHRDIFQKNENILEEATKTNLTRINYLSVTSVVIHIFQIQHIWKTPVDVGLMNWKQGVLACHFFFILYMFLMFILTRRYKNRSEIKKWLHNIPVITMIVTLFVGIIFSVLDQMITTNISPLIIASIVAGTVISMQPLISLFIYLFSYVAYYNLLALTVMEETILVTNRVNGFSILGVGFVLSIILWRYFYTTVTQKHFIERQQLQLERMAYSDSLTGLPNRRYFDDLLLEEMERTQRNNDESTLILLDIDNFKMINDEFGHPVGDEVLKNFSTLLEDNLRTADSVARFGGEEFIILIPNSNLEEGRAYAERLRRAIQNNVMQIGEHTLQITSSFGVVQIDKNHDRFDELYYKLDYALRTAKRAGKNRTSTETKLNNFANA